MKKLFIKFITFLKKLFLIFFIIALSSSNVFAAPTHVVSHNINSEENTVTGIAFNPDGTKMFIVGIIGNEVNEYSLSVGFDLSSTVTWLRLLDVSAQDNKVQDVAFNSDGTVIFVIGKQRANIDSWSLSTAYDLSGVHATNDLIATTALGGNPRALKFNPDGTKMFIVGRAGTDLNEYALSTAFDISSASFTGNGCTGGGSGATGAKPTAMNFNADGTKLFVLDKGSNIVRESVLGTGFVITSSCTYDDDNKSPNLNNMSGVSEAKAQGMAFNDDGTKMYIVGEQHDKVYELDLLTAYDVSTETFVASFDISNQEAVPTGLEFSSDGKTMFVVGKNGDEINVYVLATA